MHTNPHAFSQQHRRVQRHARNSDAYSFFNLLTGPELFEKVESLLPKHRERLFAPTETLSIFLAQALSADRSCQKAVDEAAVRRIAAVTVTGSVLYLIASRKPACIPSRGPRYCLCRRFTICSPTNIIDDCSPSRA